MIQKPTPKMGEMKKLVFKKYLSTHDTLVDQNGPLALEKIEFESLIKFSLSSSRAMKQQVFVLELDTDTLGVCSGISKFEYREFSKRFKFWALSEG